ncbi:sporulation protein YunB [Aneurinibacillus terranovensis]|uniref:sporulation protein YunB n=1 Tax=Aneurinibacillus terranovensis TaxID=278991 RepID=UPI00041829DF|nr:sporulation protein YunB [Aneurinibacillus terranovensis]
MKRFGKKKSKAPIPGKYMFILSIVVFLGLTLQTFYYIERNLEPAIREIARFRVEQLATRAINDAINKKIVQGTNFKELVEFQKDQNGKIQAALFNYNEYSRIVGETTGRVTNTLEELEQMPQTIPLGQALGSNLLAQTGPNIPITLVPYGSVQVDLNTKMQEAGINMVLITVVVVIQAKVKIVIPFSTDPAVVKSEIPISNALIVGNVPQFYYDGNGKAVGSEVPGASVPNIVPPMQINSTKIQN